MRVHLRRDLGEGVLEEVGTFRHQQDRHLLGRQRRDPASFQQRVEPVPCGVMLEHELACPDAVTFPRDTVVDERCARRSSLGIRTNNGHRPVREHLTEMIRRNRHHRRPTRNQTHHLLQETRLGQVMRRIHHRDRMPFRRRDERPDITNRILTDPIHRSPRLDHTVERRMIRRPGHGHEHRRHRLVRLPLPLDRVEHPILDERRHLHHPVTTPLPGKPLQPPDHPPTPPNTHPPPANRHHPPTAHTPPPGTPHRRTGPPHQVTKPGTPTPRTGSTTTTSHPASSTSSTSPADANTRCGATDPERRPRPPMRHTQIRIIRLRPHTEHITRTRQRHQHRPIINRIRRRHRNNHEPTPHATDQATAPTPEASPNPATPNQHAPTAAP